MFMGRTEHIRYRHKQLFALHMNLSILEECWELPEQNNNWKILKFNNFQNDFSCASKMENVHTEIILS